MDRYNFGWKTPNYHHDDFFYLWIGRERCGIPLLKVIVSGWISPGYSVFHSLKNSWKFVPVNCQRNQTKCWVRWEGECIPCDEIASHMGRKGEHLLSLKKNNKMKQSEITNKIKSQTIRVFSHSLNFYHLRVKSGENFPINFSFLQQVWEITVPTWL